MFDPIERYANVMLALVSPVRRGREQLHRFADLLISGYHAPPPPPAQTRKRRRTWLSLTDLASAVLARTLGRSAPPRRREAESFAELLFVTRDQVRAVKLDELTARNCQFTVYRQTHAEFGFRRVRCPRRPFRARPLTHKSNFPFGMQPTQPISSIVLTQRTLNPFGGHESLPKKLANVGSP